VGASQFLSTVSPRKRFWRDAKINRPEAGSTLLICKAHPSRSAIHSHSGGAGLRPAAARVSRAAGQDSQEDWQSTATFAPVGRVQELRCAATRHVLAQSWNAAVTLQKRHALVRIGPYAIVSPATKQENKAEHRAKINKWGELLLIT
jgi:hypothetical protein